MLRPLLSNKKNVTRKCVWVMLVLLVGTIVVQTQQVDRGFQAANTYAASGIDAVNLSNGNLVMNLPIAGLPGGRGGAPGYSITLQYNSKLWDTHQETHDDGNPDENGNTRYSTTSLAVSPRGGWRFQTAYLLQVTDRLNYETPNVCWLGDPIEKLSFRWKVEMEMPDGTVKQFFPETGRSSQRGMGEDGYANIDPNGTVYSAAQYSEPTCHVSQYTDSYTTAGMTYITMDGSRMRLFIPYSTSVQPYLRNWKLYSPNGTVVENAPPANTSASQRITDKNGNYVEHIGGAIVDQLGRSIEFVTDSNPGTIVRTKGVAGETVDVRIIWGDRWVQRKYRVTQAMNAQESQQFATLYETIPVIEKIVFPDQSGSQEMLFDYYADSNEPDEEEYTDGWGELKHVTLPTGAESVYEFTNSALGGDEANLASDVMDNHATEKVLGYDEVYDGQTTARTDTWAYNVSKVANSVTGPNGAGSTENLINYSGYTSWDSGMAYRSSNPDGSRTDRLWSIDLPFSQNPPGNYDGVGSGNAYVKTEFSTIPDSSGNSDNWLTAIKDYKYDKNGNVLEVLEYDWVTYGSVPKTSGRITGLPTSGLALKRKTVNTYYNQAADATASTGNGNEYNNPSAPKLLNLIKSTEVRDGSNVVKSRQEFIYDSTTTTGNLTETRVWDSTKGAVSDPLTSGNWITTSATYDSYGNTLTTTDANSVETHITYGNVAGPSGNVTDLYPTQTVVAYGTGLARTTTAVYDFYTGVVTSTTDEDNDVTNATEYDDLGRPTKAITAYGDTTHESWTVTEYHDDGRFVVVKSDLEEKGDGKKVTTQFYDQLGRVRLSKTLEDASTQSATNETDGIKVQTRYKATGSLCPWDNATGPDEVCTAQLTSNPYRADYSYNAGSEDTMGWTVTRTQNNGKRSEVETYGGAALPKPFVTSGFNTNTSGVVKTEIDLNATTVTDQAGKLRRSITNALGQLTRVDEPNSSNVLGSVSSPNQATYYTYNTLGAMIRVQQGSQDRYFMYDSLGRTLRIRQPEQEVNTSLNTSGNPDNNSWTGGFTYDNNGNVLTTTDAKGTTITNTYDALNRALTRTYSDGTPTVTNYYDGEGLPAVPDHSKGKLTKVYSSVSESKYTEFDLLGRLKESQQYTDGNTYTSKYTYNLSGALVEEEYPSGRVVKNVLDNNGDLSIVQSKKNASSGYWHYADGFTYNAAGGVTKMQLGNGLWETAQFNTRQQVTQLGLGIVATDTSHWKIDYEFGELQTNGTVDATKNTGNIGKQTLTVPGTNFVQAYKYDPLDRLTEAKETTSTTQNWIQQFGYDRYGNRTSFSQTIGSTTTTSTPSIDAGTNRFSGSQGFTYDANGNITQDADPLNSHVRAFTFNGDNKQTQVTDVKNSNHVVGTYYYDGEGKRVKKVTDTETTIFVYSAGKLVAEYSTNVTPVEDAKVAYTTADHLGSPRVITDQNGQIASRRDFMPFGEEIVQNVGGRTSGLQYGSTNDEVRQKFTGYQKDAETSLDFAEARMYENRFGRFTAVDPLVASGKSANPQTFNRFIYVGNNPINTSDPSGLDWYRKGNAFEWSDDNITLHGGETIDDTWSKVSDHVYFGGDDIGWVALDPNSRNWTTGLDSREDAIQFLDPGQNVSLIDGIDEMMTVADVATGIIGVVRSGGKFLIREGAEIAAERLIKRSATQILREAAEKELRAAGKEVTTLAINRMVGLAAERIVEKQLLKEGYEILGSQVTARLTNGELRYIDRLVKSPSGDILAIEVKSGGSFYSASQRNKDALIESGGAVLGKNAPESLQGRVMKFATNVRRVE